MSFRDENEDGRDLRKPFLHTGNWYRKGSRQSSMMRSSQVIRDAPSPSSLVFSSTTLGTRTLKREKKNLKRERKTRKDRKQIFIGGGKLVISHSGQGGAYCY